jgi:uncharacterized protein
MKFLPSREPITAFGNGGFRFADMSHQGSLLVLPSGMRAWGADDFSELELEHFEAIVSERDQIEFLIIGCGKTMLPLPKAVSQYLLSKQIAFDVMTTSAAVRTYNIVLGDDRQVAAGLISVADATR